jgi:tRNA pseudouridine55 synthase
LGPGAHLASLVRTSVREFQIEAAHGLEELEVAGRRENDSQRPITDIMLNHGTGSKTEPLQSLCLHPRLVLPEFPAVTAPLDALTRIRHGGSVNLPEFTKAALVRVFEGQSRLIAIARRIAGTLFHPKVVLF